MGRTTWLLLYVSTSLFDPYQEKNDTNLSHHEIATPDAVIRRRHHKTTRTAERYEMDADYIWDYVSHAHITTTAPHFRTGENLFVTPVAMREDFTRYLQERGLRSRVIESRDLVKVALGGFVLGVVVTLAWCI